MATDRRKQILLGILIVLLGALAYRAVTTSPVSSPSSNPARASGRGGQGGRGNAMAAPDVHMSALNSERPKPVGGERNLFRFRPKAAPAPPPVAGSAGPPETPALPPAPSGPPPPPPIALKFIGTVQSNGGRTTFAVLTDGQGPPMSGKEGDTIAGRYKILRIGVESIEMSYLDGRGRQTIRMNTGS
jgi:hypothetical protein